MDGYCSGFADVYICGNNTYSVPSGFQGGTWSDMSPAVIHPTGSTVAIGLNPILLVHP